MTKCRLCDHLSIKYCKTICKLPVFMGCVPLNYDNEIKHDMKIGVCENCGTLQITDLPPENLVYLKNHNVGFGQTWSRHYDEFADFIKRHNPMNVLEIGAGNKNLLSRIVPKYDWTCLELNPEFLKNDKLPSYACWKQGEFNEYWTDSKHYDIIVMSHVFEHIRKPYLVFKNLRDKIDYKQKIILSIPKLYEYLSHHNLNCLHFEHTFCNDMTNFIKLFNFWGFKVIEYKSFEDHSDFFVLQKDSKIIEKINGNMTCCEIINKYENMIDDYINFIYEIKDRKHNDLYIFGAHVTTQFLLSLGLDELGIIGIVDNDINKIGMKLYGSKYAVFKPSMIIEKCNVITGHCGVYRKEIDKQLLEMENMYIL